MYVPGHGRLSISQVQEALAEFQRRIEAGESDVVVVVGTGVPLLDVLDELEEFNCGAIFEARFDDIGVVDESTVAEIVIIKFRERAHQRAVNQIVVQLNEYAVFTNYRVLAYGGAVQLPGRVRIPDCGISPFDPPLGENPPMYHLIVEVELKNRSIRRNDETFPALALLYRREGPGANATIVDVVSFGTAPFQNAHGIEQTIEHRVRRLPLPTEMEVRAGNPWTADDNPFIIIPSDDILFQARESR
ncbi:hypothetical protein R1sor_022408 [Riccia sorocarpa]|uniref:Uncharacterized protein n=1 Tax=Riccia sorocarpa TaxID=122646 RepID=A0ABD3GLR9_9MARC